MTDLHGQELADLANELYWGSDTSVNRIADELSLSKGALYELIDPLPSGLPCPDCGQPVQFLNRTARDRGFVVCVECGFEEEEEALRERMEHEGGIFAPPPAPAVQTSPSDVRAPSGRSMVGAMLLGVAAGLLIGSLRRRR